MKNRLLYLLTIALIFGACSDDTLGNYGKYSEGEHATLNLTINVPAQQHITSRATCEERETDIEQLAIIAWEVTSGRKMSINLTDKLTKTGWSPDHASSTYTLSEAIPVLTGHYRAYCIANWESHYGANDNTGTRLTFADLERMSEAEIRDITFWNFEKKHEIFGNNGFPMTQVLKEFNINPGDNRLSNIVLDRASAHIQFKIRNSTDDNKYTGDNKPDFVPTRYTVYRAPLYTDAFILDDKTPVQILQSNTFDTERNPIVLQPDHDAEDFYEFDFHMLENRQPLKEGLNSIADRERWDFSGDAPEIDLDGDNTIYTDRKFTNAPAGATFVVIEGSYTGPAHKENGKYSSERYVGTVTYVIHLGNFSESGPPGHPGSFGDFNVLRNELQTYEITVEGARSIVLNVEVEDGQQHNPAVEGELSQLPVANLDAHYSKVMMRIPTATINKDVDEIEVILSSVKNSFKTETFKISDLEADPELDYKWIQFQKPGDDLNTFPKYAGADRHMQFDPNGNTGSGYGYVTDLARDLARSLEAGETGSENLRYAVRSGDYFYTAAFIDENIYSDPKWPLRDWAGVNARPRRISMTPGEGRKSPDGMSILSNVAAVYVNQRPVSTTYTLNADMERYNPFGLEQVMEPTSTDDDLNAAPMVGDKQLALYDKQKPYYDNGFFAEAYWWDSPILNGSAGHPQINSTTPQRSTRDLFPGFDNGQIEDDYESFHKISADGSDYVFSPAANCNTVTIGLVTHNRDLDGDGYIKGDELRWYIPDFVQYLIYSYGYNLIQEELRLQDLAEEARIKTRYPSLGNGLDVAFPRYMTSSGGDKQLYWQDQNGAASFICRNGTGSDGEKPEQSAIGDSPGGDWMSMINRIRFARNLGQYQGAETDAYTLMSQHHAAGGKENSIRYLNPNIARNYNIDGFYPFHYSTDANNLLPYALEYNEKPLALWNSGKEWAIENLRKPTAAESQQAIYDRVIKQYEEEYKVKITDGKLPDGWRVPNQRELMSLFVLDVPRKLISFYDQSEIISCTFIDPHLWSERFNLPFMLSGGSLTLPGNYARYYGYVILVRDIDPYTGTHTPIAL